MGIENTPYEIRKVSAADVLEAENAKELFDMYHDEVRTAGMPVHKPDEGAYHALEDCGILHAWGLYREGLLVGFLSLLVSHVPHFGEKIATTESFYVRPEHRGSGTGRGLLKSAEAFARETGCVGFWIPAPVGGSLSKAISIWGYRKAYEAYFKGLADD